MRYEQAELIRCRPTHVAGLSAAASPRLGDGPLDRDHHVTEVRTSAGWKDESRQGPRRRSARLPGVRGERFRWKKGERQDVGRSRGAHVLRIEGRQLSIVRKDQPDR